MVNRKREKNRQDWKKDSKKENKRYVWKESYAVPFLLYSFPQKSDYYNVLIFRVPDHVMQNSFTVISNVWFTELVFHCPDQPDPESKKVDRNSLMISCRERLAARRERLRWGREWKTNQACQETIGSDRWRITNFGEEWHIRTIHRKTILTVSWSNYLCRLISRTVNVL